MDLAALRRMAYKAAVSPNISIWLLENYLQQCESAGYDGLAARLRTRLQTERSRPDKEKERKEILLNLFLNGALGKRVSYKRWGQSESQFDVILVGASLKENRAKIKHIDKPRYCYWVDPLHIQKK